MKTVRCALIFPFTSDGKGEVLFLQKDPQSKNPLAFELPGGKIYDNLFERFLYWIAPAKYQYKFELRNLKREIWEETGVDLEDRSVFLSGEWEYINSATGKDTTVRQYCAIVSQRPSIKLNTLSEDKHVRHTWLRNRDFESLLYREEGCRDGFISENSSHFDWDGWKALC